MEGLNRTVLSLLGTFIVHPRPGRKCNVSNGTDRPYSVIFFFFFFFFFDSKATVIIISGYNIITGTARSINVD